MDEVRLRKFAGLTEAARRLNPHELAERQRFVQKMKKIAKKIAVPELGKAKSGKIEVEDRGDRLAFEFDVRKKFGEYPEPHPDLDSLAHEEIRRFPFAQAARDKVVAAFQRELGEKPKKKKGVFGFAREISQFDQVQVVLNGKTSPGIEMHDVGLDIVFKGAGRKIF